MIIKRATTDDANNIAALAVQVWLDTYAVEGVREVFSTYVWQHLSPAKFKQKLMDPQIEIYKVIEEEHLIAFAEVNYNSPCETDSSIHFEIDKLYVQERFCGKNIGSQLIIFLNNLCKQRNISSMWLSVYEKNFRAIKFYNKHNFMETGEIYFELGPEKHRNIVLSRKVE